MSDICAAIAEDIANYKALCNYYNEPIQYKQTHYGSMIEDCYGEHYELLNKRFDSEFTITDERETKNV